MLSCPGKTQTFDPPALSFQEAENICSEMLYENTDFTHLQGFSLLFTEA